MAIAITFNNLTPYDKIKEQFTADHGLNIVLSIMCRIIAVVYDKDIFEVIVRMKTLGAKLKNVESLYPEHLFTLFMQPLIKSITQTKEGLAAKNVVILIDEMMKVVDGKETTELTKHLESAITAVIRGVLNTRFNSSAGQEMDLALLLSSLEVPPDGIREDSGRSIKVIVLPPKLAVDDVIRSWWKLDGLTCSGDDYHKLQLIASTINNLPRVVEAVDRYLRANFKANMTVDEAFIQSLFEEIVDIISLQFSITSSLDKVDPKST